MARTLESDRIVRSPRGRELSCRDWGQEAALRLLSNNLDPEVAKDPKRLIVYGGRGKAARDWESFDAIVAALRSLGNDETLLVQSGKPVGVFPTHTDAPRVLIANALLVPRWATDEIFWDLEARGLTMYGQMTAGSWIYIGTQGILQGTYETLASLARIEFQSEDLNGRWMLSSGLGEMGGAQPLAVTMLGGVALVVDVDRTALERQLAHRYLDVATTDLDDALGRVREAVMARRSLSVGLRGNAAEVYPELVRRGLVPDIVSDQTACHDLTVGYIPRGFDVEEAATVRAFDLPGYLAKVKSSIAVEARAILDLQRLGAKAFDYGNNFRTQAREAGVANAFEIPGYVPRYIRPLFAVGSGPFR
ncbi:MAG: urocanate hydratase, partial [Thermoplasmata archaeon]